MIIDCHGHFTTAPPSLKAYRQALLAVFEGGGDPNAVERPVFSDQDVQAAIAKQLAFQRDRGTDLTILSPIAAWMGHHQGDQHVSEVWSRVSNDLIHQVCQLYPHNFAGACQLPQSAGVSPKNCIDELDRCIRELGFVGCNLNPDPTGGNWTDPPLPDRWWYPLYEKLVELDVPAMIHVSSACNPNFIQHHGSHYLNGDTTAFTQLMASKLFHDFPTLKIIIPHGGGAVPYHWGRFRGLAQDFKWTSMTDILKNVYFDTCVYHLPGMDLLTKVVPDDNILFASEMIGAVKSVDPETGHYFDDTKRYVDGLPLSSKAREKIFSGNALKLFSRLEVNLSDSEIAASEEAPAR